MNNMPLIHSQGIRVRPSETNHYGCLRTDATANYMEDIATEHAALLGVGLGVLLEHNISWAMSKMRITFNRRPQSGETLTLSTRPLAGHRHTYLREFFFTDNDGHACITAMTWWVVFDLTTRKMSALPEALDHFPQNEEPVLESAVNIPAIKRFTDTLPGPQFSIRQADIDQNNHVNNVRYVSFVEEAGFLFNPQAALRQIELIFRAESKYRDIISTTSALENASLTSSSPARPLASYSLVHSLHTTNGELLRGRTLWAIEPKNS